MPKKKEIKDKDNGLIKVADITLAQLSRGIYRSTATAFKELVSNAYDADATEVYINTNFPEFDYFSISDNGAGMSLENFINYFKKEGIGVSLKRKRNKDKTDKYKRLIIGRLGIGMMATGQLCHSFIIESHYYSNDGKGLAFRAEILLEDTSIPDKEDLIREEAFKGKNIEVGQWSYERIKFNKSKIGFNIISDDVRATLRRDFKKAVKDQNLDNFSFSYYDLYKEYYDKSKKSIRDWNLYLETIWELSILCPLPYYGKLSEYPLLKKEFRKSLSKTGDLKAVNTLLENKQKTFLKDNFRLFFDGIELKRLIQLPTSKGKVNKVYHINFNEKVFKNKLKFSGYLFSQIPTAIIPLELNGIQIRVRGVGIGGYDSTFLKYYKYVETVRNRWVSGEIFVEEGLESALNIDRDSFNEHDEHFKKLQNFVHDKLNDVFDEARDISLTLSEDRRGIKAKELKKGFSEIVNEVTKNKYKLLIKKLKSVEQAVIINEKRKIIILNEAYRPIKKKKADEIMRVVELAYEISKKLVSSQDERDKLFNDLLKSIFKKLL